MNPPESPPPGPFTPLSPKHISRLGFWVIFAMLMAILATITIPNFVPAHRTTSKSVCPANLKAIDGAVQQWALEHQKARTDTYALSEPQILAYMRGSVLPVCPTGGHYSPGKNVGDRPTCSFAAQGHTL